MFTTPRTACYLNGFAGHGDDPDAKELKLVFHVSPITHELATEISPMLADRLFRLVDKEWQPAPEMPKASFSSIIIPLQNITFNSLPDGDEGPIAMIPAAAVSNLRAARAYAGGKDYRLEFDAVIPMDGITMRLVEKFYKSTAFLTMEAVTRQIDFQAEDESHADEQELLQEAADGKSAATGEGRRRRRKKETEVPVGAAE